MNNASAFRFSVIFANLASAFRFVCFDQYNVQCRVENLNPLEEGTYVMRHVPEQAYILLMTQLNTTTVDHLLLGKLMPSIKHLYIVDSSRVKNILMPANNNVERLIITNTPLTAIVFEENAALSWLTMVETELNHIPASLGRLSNLLHFKLNQSPMRHFDLDIFCNFQKLETIDLEYNRIESVISREYFHECCKSLQHINFKHNALKRIDVNMLAPYSKLQDVYFANNLIASLTGRLKHILMFSVTLNDNSLKTLDLCEWGPLSKMITFYVRRNNLIEIPKCLNQLQNLEIIGLENNQIASVNMAAFHSLTNLRYLFLQDNRISAFTYNPGLFLPALCEINLQGNLLSHPNTTRMLFQSIKVLT